MGNSPVPAFSLEKSRYDESTYWGRIQHFQEITDPRTLLTSDETLQKSLDMLQQFKEGLIYRGKACKLPAGVTDSQLWEARKIKEAIIHPDFNKPIPAFGRMSSFAPANIPICGLLLWPTNNPVIIVGGQVINQTYNVMCNYSNRSASGEMSNAVLATAYVGAVTSSGGIAYVLNNYAKKLTANPAMSQVTRGFLRGFVPFVAVAMAGCVNVLIIRQKELTQGVAVFDDEGTKRGYSTAAGRNALAKCCLARVLWNIPLMIFPPLLMARIQQTSLLKAKPLLRIPAELSIITAMILAFLPPSIAVFPQRDSLPVADLEPEFQGLADSHGRPITRLTFNKGL